MAGYSDHNFNQVTPKPTMCYVCGNSGGDITSIDHIIPNSLFASSSPNRPKIYVHPNCNNGKSKDDERFLRQLQLMCGLNPDAEAELTKLLRKANAQKDNAFIIGRSNKVRDYKLARSLLDNNVWGLELKMQGETLPVLHIGKDNASKMSEYVKRLCRGLYVRNIPDAVVGLPRLTGIQYAKAAIDNKYVPFMKPVGDLIGMAGDNAISQEWDGRVLYYIGRTVETPNSGFVFVEFYRELGYLAHFKPE